MKKTRIVIVGSNCVGKTSLVLRYVLGKFNEQHKPTLSDCYDHIAQFPDGCHHCIEVLDTAGGDHFPVMRTLDIQRGDVFMIVFSVDSPDTLSAAKETRKQIQDIKGCSKVRAVWVGNKIDLVSSRKVTAEEALLKAFTFGDAYIETSAKFIINVDCVFQSVLSLMCMEPVKKDLGYPDSKKKVSKFRTKELINSSKGSMDLCKSISDY
ncbi:hypothetical protein ACJMK2_043039 [Sinanodonta woodiana]|uniref:Uncharacterized protein n=1 Tax=Sinanodonta woodiana TaxID=1069815 RepID=A0ABD3VZA4_SINWO